MPAGNGFDPEGFGVGGASTAEAGWSRLVNYGLAGFDR